MKKIIPSKLHPEDIIRVIAPSRSFSIIGKENREIAKNRFDELGLTLTFGKHIEQIDNFSIKRGDSSLRVSSGNISPYIQRGH